jgi:undecaprenyl-diphosphatase
MSPFEALLLGIVQGATEFLPVSSSGHLVLTEALLGVSEGGLFLEVLLHAATLLAVLLYFRKRVGWLLVEGSRRGAEGREARRWIVWLLLGTLPAGAVGILFEEGVARVFESPGVALVGLLVTGAVLWSSRWARSRGRSPLGVRALLIGLGQAAAILPGISRSGTTIAVGMWAGVPRSDAAEFSFLLSVPAIGGATVLQVLDIAGSGAAPGLAALPLLLGFASAFVSGYAAIAGLLAVLRRRGLTPFAWYCWAIGTIGLLITSL